MLEVRIPKPEQAKPRRIEIAVGDQPATIEPRHRVPLRRPTPQSRRRALLARAAIVSLILSITPGMLRMRLSSHVVSVISRMADVATIVALRISF